MFKIDISFIISFVSLLLIGILIGLQREIQHKCIGMRTTLLILLGSFLFTLTASMLNEARIIAQIVSGVGFIGAGIIFKSNDTIKNLTTAVLVWALAALGVLLGLKQIGISIFFGLTIFIILNIKQND